MPADIVDLKKTRASLAAMGELVAAHPEVVTAEAQSRLERTLRDTEMGRPKKDPSERKDFQASVRMVPDDVERLDALAQAMTDSLGVEVSRAAALRKAMAEGLDVLEKKFRVVRAKKKRTK